MFALLGLLLPAAATAQGPFPLTLWQVFRVDPDGANLETVLQADVALAAGSIDVHPGSREIYWSRFREFVPSPEGMAFSVYRADSGGGSLQEVFAGGLVGQIELDPAGGKIYYIQHSDCEPCSAILRRNLDGSGLEQLAGDIAPWEIAIDPVGGKLYWGEGDAIVVANLDGSQAQTFLTETGAPLSMSVDSAGGKLYWATWGGSIRRVGLDGSQLEELVTGLNQPWGLALDVAGDRMWWTERYEGKIHRARLDGSEQTTILTVLVEPLRIAYLPADGAGDGSLYVVTNPEEVVIEVPATTPWGVFVLTVVLVATSTMVLRRRGRDSGRY
jgi:hypothetical protein